MADKYGAPWEIMARQEARERGLKKYYTGRPCRAGHIARRYTVTGACCSCAAAAQVAYMHRKAAGRVVLRLRVHPDDVRPLQEMADALNAAREFDR